MVHMINEVISLFTCERWLITLSLPANLWANVSSVMDKYRYLKLYMLACIVKVDAFSEFLYSYFSLTTTLTIDGVGVCRRVCILNLPSYYYIFCIYIVFYAYVGRGPQGRRETYQRFTMYY